MCRSTCVLSPAPQIPQTWGRSFQRCPVLNSQRAAAGVGDQPSVAPRGPARVQGPDVRAAVAPCPVTEADPGASGEGSSLTVLWRRTKQKVIEVRAQPLLSCRRARPRPNCALSLQRQEVLDGKQGKPRNGAHLHNAAFACCYAFCVFHVESTCLQQTVKPGVCTTEGAALMRGLRGDSRAFPQRHPSWV